MVNITKKIIEIMRSYKSGPNNFISLQEQRRRREIDDADHMQRPLFTERSMKRLLDDISLIRSGQKPSDDDALTM